MEDNFEKYLKTEMKSLPEINHDKNLWDRIANELNFEERLKQTCKSLPVHEHSKNLWNRIQNRDANKLKFRKLLYANGIAASIILVTAIYIFHINSKDFSISFSTEIQHNSTQHAVGMEQNPNVTMMLGFLCQYTNLNCNSPDFLQIKNQISELETEIQKLNQVISAYGESPGLIKCLIKMENQKAYIVNEFIKKSE